MGGPFTPTISRSLTVLVNSLFLWLVWLRFIWLKPRSHSADKIGSTSSIEINFCKCGTTTSFFLNNAYSNTTCALVLLSTPNCLHNNDSSESPNRAFCRGSLGQDNLLRTRAEARMGNVAKFCKAWKNWLLRLCFKVPVTGRLSYCQTGVGVHWGGWHWPPGVDFRVIIEGVGQITGGLNPQPPPGNYHTD